MKILSLALTALSFLSFAAHAENYTAKNCEIFISKINASPGSHDSGGLHVVVKVGFIGNDEFIQKVGMWAQTHTQDLGNSPSCHYGMRPDPFTSQVIEPNSGNYGTEYGEYAFGFMVQTGSVTSDCPGYHFSYTGSFFVQTNKNTYWFNPNLDSTQQFDFDANAFQSLMRQGFYSEARTADHDNLKYFNPMSCR